MEVQNTAKVKKIPLAIATALSECSTGAHDVSIDCIEQSASFV